MLSKINNEQTKFKDLVYAESFWTGRRTITYDGVPLTKRKRGVYALTPDESSELLTVKGNQLIGVTVTLFGQQIEVLRKVVWYEWVLAILVFIPAIVFCGLSHDGGNIGLCVLAAGICGGIGGGLYFVNFYLLRRQDKIYLKIILTAELLTVCALSCYIITALLCHTFMPF